MPGRQPLQFYLCSNQFSEEIDFLPLKQNWISIVVLVLSVIRYVVISLKIKHFKVKHKQAVAPMTHVEQNKC